MDENKKRALTAALAQIDKQFGKGTVMRMGDKSRRGRTRSSAPAR